VLLADSIYTDEQRIDATDILLKKRV